MGTFDFSAVTETLPVFQRENTRFPLTWFYIPSLFWSSETIKVLPVCFLSLAFVGCIVSLPHAPDFLCLPRDFQFGHMDGNDYINSLIMG